MIKKWLSVFMVLATASAASATIVEILPIPEGEPGSAANPLMPSDEIVIPVFSDNGLISLYAILTVTEGPATIVGAIDTADCADYGWDPTLSMHPSGVPGQSVEIGLGTVGTPPSGLVAYYLLHCDNTGLVTVTLTPSDAPGMDIDLIEPTITGTITIHQVPEPMTLGLLGLGGLAMLRRRK
jgi:hypothetical protein